MSRTLRILVVCGIVFLINSNLLLAQDPKDRKVEQYLCKDVLRDSGSNRDVAIAFLHGFLLGKSGDSKFNLDVLQTQTTAFIERCLDNPGEKAIDAIAGVKK